MSKNLNNELKPCEKYNDLQFYEYILSNQLDELAKLRKERKREKQKNYVKSKREQRFHNFNFWMLCDSSKANKIKTILTSLNEEEIDDLIKKYGSHLERQ